MDTLSAISALSAEVATLATFPTAFNGTLTGAVDINSAFTLTSGYMVCLPFTPLPIPLLLVMPELPMRPLEHHRNDSQIHEM